MTKARERKPRTARSILPDETFPESVRVAAKSPRKQVKEALKGLTIMEQANRQSLANGSTASNPNHHVLGTALRFVKKGRQTFLGYVLRAARNGDADAAAWWKIFSGLNEAQQARVDFDDVCEHACVTPDRIMAIVVSAAMRMGSDVGDFVAASMHPAIVAKTAESAMRIKGEHADIAQRDREFLFQHSRFIPVATKGVSVSVSAQAAAAAQGQPSVPSFADSLAGANEAQAEQHRQIGPVIDVDSDVCF